MANLEDLRIDTPMPRPRRAKRSPVPALLIVAAAVGAGWYFFGSRIQQLRIAVQPVREVEVYVVPSAAAGPEGSFTAGGYLEVIPPGPTVVSSMIDGRVAELLIKPGDKVAAGQTVARLDDSLLKQDVAVQASEVEVAQASLALVQAGFRTEEIEVAQAEVSQANSRLRKAEADMSRSDQLYAEGVISAAEHDASRAALEQAQSTVDAAQSRLELLETGQRYEEINIAQQRVDAARAQLGRSQTLLSKTVVKSQSAGVVLSVYVQPGGWVSPGDSREHAGAICSIFDPRQIQAWVDVNQRDIGKVYAGQAVVLTTDAYPDEKIAGKVSLISPSATLAKNTVQVKIAIAEPPDYLRPEMSVQAAFQPEEAEDAPAQPSGFAVPASAIARAGSETQVLVISAGKATARAVELGTEIDGKVLVTSGVGAGDQLILNPAGISAGQSVKVKGSDQK